MAAGIRLWRVRKRHDHLDATLRESRGDWELVFARNDRAFLSWRFPTRARAEAEATAKLKELERAGWLSHW